VIRRLFNHTLSYWNRDQVQLFAASVVMNDYQKGILRVLFISPGKRRCFSNSVGTELVFDIVDGFE
jgi:hypothetical protein